MSRRLKFCQATNSAGRRCEYRVKGHPEQDGRPLHKRGDVTWTEPRGYAASRAILDEAFTMDTTTAQDSHTVRQPGLINSKFQATFKTPPDSKDFFDSLFRGAGKGRPLGALGDHQHVSIGGHDITGLVSSIDFHGTPEFAEDKWPGPKNAEGELAAWWRDTAESEIGQTVAKAVEYGSTDLVDIGQALARVAGRKIPDSEAAEWGIFFYLEGKLSRWRSAIQRGDLPSFDTLLDIGVYARMAQRVRQEGSWPGTADYSTPAKDPFHSMCDTPCGSECK